jgi:penicillin-binding protein 1A
MTPDDTFIDQPVEIPLKGGEIWRPNDDVPPSGKPMTLRDALALSRNRITAQVMQGRPGGRRAARATWACAKPARARAVARARHEPGDAEEMVASYATIANGGSTPSRRWSRIENRQGDVLAEFAPAPPERALDGETDKTLLDVMRDVVTRGTGGSIRTRSACAATWPARPAPRRTTRTAGSS